MRSNPIQPTETQAASGIQKARAGLVIGALGVVFGDIGTSPIYTLQTIFSPDDPHPVPINEQNIYGIVSLIFWSVMIIVTLHVRDAGDARRQPRRRRDHGADHAGAQVRPQAHNRTALVMATIGIFGAALFFGDSMITPAISVLSSVEGLKVIAPQFEDWIVPITAVIIVLLFSVQRHGTAVVGRFFGPIMILWFTAIAACGVMGVLAIRRS